MNIDDTFITVHHDFYDLLEPNLGKKVKVFYFNQKNEIEETIGIFEQIISKGELNYIEINYDELVRLDKIIAINGRPGPAFNDFDSFAKSFLASGASNDE